MPGLICEHDKVLFFGDSITDAGRPRDNDLTLGFGYPNFVASIFHSVCPGFPVTFVNRGISGNRVKDLRVRLWEDCLDLKPNLLSILIGINDTWRRYDSNDPTSVESFYEDYKYILTKASEQGIRLLLLEPFLLHVPEDKKAWREDLDPKIEAVRRLAREFNAPLLPLDKIFADLAKIKGPAFWAADGVHPTQAGAALIALEWLKLAAGISLRTG